MFGKLMKHEWRATARQIMPVFVVNILFVVLFVIARLIKVPIVSQGLFILLPIIIFAQVVTTLILLVVRYYKNLYGSEGYLTHTLPVKPRLLLASKLLVSFIWMCLSYILAAASVFVFIFKGLLQEGEEIKQLTEMGTWFIKFIGFEQNPGLLGLIVFWVLIFGILNTLLNLYLSISLGSTPLFAPLGVGGPIIVYFILSAIGQVLSVVAALLIPIGISPVMEANGGRHFQLILSSAFEFIAVITTRTYSAMPSFIPLGSYIILPLVAVVYCLITVQIIKKKTNLR